MALNGAKKAQVPEIQAVFQVQKQQVSAALRRSESASQRAVRLLALQSPEHFFIVAIVKVIMRK